jgi:hypothetical protein
MPGKDLKWDRVLEIWVLGSTLKFMLGPDSQLHLRSLPQLTKKNAWAEN